MTINLQDLGKKYNRQWIFRHLAHEIQNGEKVAITGHNGSGKSTLLKIIGGYVTPSEGQVNYVREEQGENHQLCFSIAAPYLNLIEEFTLLEHLDFHQKFKTALVSHDEICKLSGLNGSEDKIIRDFSSGMKQRLRLSLAFFFQSKAILLDEPTANLDELGTAWYKDLIRVHLNGRTLIVASNHPDEYSFCDQVIAIEKFKPQRVE